MLVQVEKCEGCGTEPARRGPRGFCAPCYTRQQKWLADLPLIYRPAKCNDCSEAITQRNTSGFCKPCRTKRFWQDPEHKRVASERSKTWAKENRDRKNASQKQRCARLDRRWARSKYYAEKRGFDWSLSLEDYAALVMKPCHYCGGPLSSIASSLDRKDSSRGYSLANVVQCCWSCNKVKSDVLTCEEMEVAMAAVMSFRSKNGDL